MILLGTTSGCSIQDSVRDRSARSRIGRNREILRLPILTGPAGATIRREPARRLAEQAVALEIVESVSHETLRGTLKKSMTRRKIEYWVIPPAGDAEFAASMEEVVDVYARPYDSRYPFFAWTSSLFSC
jgi:hypothetical protein